MEVVIKQIEWDISSDEMNDYTDYEQACAAYGLPSEDTVVFDDICFNDIESMISEYLSDVYGFCLKHYEYEIID